MAFDVKIAEMLAYRSAYICNNPDCNTLTVGPALNDPSLKLKLGEAAHIIGEKPKAARYENIGADKLSSIENGIWLCANCHTMIDKIDGKEFPKQEIYEWKNKHEKMISMLLKTHKSPVPLLVKQTENFATAQYLVDYLSDKAVLFQQTIYENPEHVFLSLDNIRVFISHEIKKIHLDDDLKRIFTEIRKSAQEVMSETSKSSGNINYQELDALLRVMRIKAGKQLKLLDSKYGCNISGPLTIIVS